MIKNLITDIKSSRRGCSEFYSKYFSSLISPYLSAICVKLKISANTTTTLMLFSGVLSSLLLLSNSIYIQFIAALSLPLINIWDTVDGEIARYTKKTSKVGVYLDLVYQVIIDLFIYFAIGIKLYLATNNILFLLPSIVLMFFYTITSYSTLSYGNLMISRNSMSKNTYLNLSFNPKSKVQFIAHITTSNVAFYHLYWMFLLVDILLIEFNYYSSPFSQFIFMSYLAVMSVIKFVVKFKKAINLLE